MPHVSGYEILGEMVRAVTGQPLDVYAQRAVFEPLGMSETEFRPLGKGGGDGRRAPQFLCFLFGGF